MKDRDVAVARGTVGERADILAELFVHRQREDVGLVSEVAEQIADPASTVADGIALVRRRYPLIDDHGYPLPCPSFGSA